MKNIVAICLILSFCGSAFSDSRANHRVGSENGIANGLGAGGSVFWTWGFLYRHHFEDRFGVSASLGGWFTESRGHLGNSLGLLYSVAHHQFFWKAMPNTSIRVYLVAYLSNIYHRNSYDYDDDKESSKNALHSGLGAGPGIEFFFNQYFSIHMELPWMTFMRFTKNGARFRDSHPHFGMGLLYYF